MAVETTPWDSAEDPDSPEAILACPKTAFEGGNPGVIVLALNNATRAKGLMQGALTARSDMASVIESMKALGLELPVKVA